MDFEEQVKALVAMMDEDDGYADELVARGWFVSVGPVPRRHDGRPVFVEPIPPPDPYLTAE